MNPACDAQGAASPVFFEVVKAVMRRVLIVHPLETDRPGGAEQSLKRHIECAPPDVRVTVAGPDEAVDVRRFDAVVIGNVRPAGGLGFESEITATLRWAARLADYRGFSLRSERDVHPCTFRDGRCLTGTPPRKTRCDCSTAMRDANELLYNACSAVQFLSPAHQRVINQLIQIRVSQHVIASPINLRIFRNLIPPDQRPAKALILGDAIRISDTAAKRARRRGYEPEVVAYHTVAFDQMPALYNRFRATVVDPVMFHAFGRVAIEALACGCEVIASERVGAMSWRDPLQASQEANGLFWQVIREGMEGITGRPVPVRRWPQFLWRRAS